MKVSRVQNVKKNVYKIYTRMNRNHATVKFHFAGTFLLVTISEKYDKNGIGL